MSDAINSRKPIQSILTETVSGANPEQAHSAAEVRPDVAAGWVLFATLLVSENRICESTS